MESIGDKLRLAREKNNLTIEQIARETHVARRFLKALEDEDFSVFPGETYAMGFLRNYAENLGLNAEELIGIYRNIKIQEQPLPMTELLDAQPRLPPRRLILIVALGVIVVAAAGYIVYKTASRGSAASAAAEKPPPALQRTSCSRTRCARSGSARETGSPFPWEARTTASWWPASGIRSR